MAIREHNYYWAALTSNQKTVLQFTKDGQEQLWGDVLEDYPGKIIRIYWLPFDHEVAASLLTAKLPFWPSVQNVPPIWIDVSQGDTGIPLQTFDQEVYNYWLCENCKGTITWYDTSVELVCPLCGSKNEWFCHHCQEIIDKPLLRPKGKVECPKCAERGEPYGLKRTKALTSHSEPIYRATYALAINEKYAVEYSDRGAFIRRYKIGDIIGK